jgi:hypothetical protein
VATRYFSLEEAQALVPQVRRLLGQALQLHGHLRVAIARLSQAGYEVTWAMLRGEDPLRPHADDDEGDPELDAQLGAFEPAASSPGFDRAASSPGFDRATSSPGFDRAASSPGFDRATSSPGFDRATSSPGFGPSSAPMSAPEHDQGLGAALPSLPPRVRDFRAAQALERARMIYMTLRETVAEIEALGAAVKGVVEGLVDFHSWCDGEREVVLCWKLGEDEIGFFHATEEGFAARESIHGHRFTATREFDRATSSPGFATTPELANKH